MTIPKAKKRLRPARGLGSAYTRTRRVAAERVRKLAEEYREQMRAEAKAAMARAEARSARSTDMADQRYRHSVISGVAKQARGFLASQGHSDISLDFGINEHIENVDAWTDFERIVVKWPAARIPTGLMQHKEVLAQVRQMRGIFRHEVGHIFHTTPWNEVVNDTNFTQDGRYFDQVWNLLEDQRMEGLVVDTSPKAADDLKAMVLNVVLANGPESPTGWLYLAGRDYLSNRLRSLSAASFDAQVGAGKAQEWQDIVAEYIAADTNEKLGLTVEKAGIWLRDNNLVAPPSLDGHTRQAGYNPNRNSDGGYHSNWADRTRTTARQPGQSNFRKNWDVDGFNLGGGSGQEGGQSNIGNGLSFSEELNRELDEVRRKDTVDRELAAVTANAYEAADTAGLPNYDGPTQSMTADQEAVAMEIAIGMEQALTSYITEASPTWLQHQEQGVVDPLAYRTSGAGLRDYRRYLKQPDQEKPLDVHISLVCDSSGSMGGNMVALSQVMLGTKLMADKLGIGHTLGLWSTDPQNYRVWADGEVEPVVFPSMGGTDPTIALDDLENHNPEGASHHLVLIFTDGAWGTFPTLQNWQSGDGERTIVLVRYGFHDGEFQGDMGADQHIQINNVLDLAGELTDALSGVLSDASSAGGWD